MKNISIKISDEQIIADLNLSIKNFENGNFKKWGLKAIMPEIENNESYNQAAIRFLKESNWKENVEKLFPKIEKWWNDIGGKLIESLANDLKVEEPDKYIIYPVPFGPGGSYNAKQSAIYIRIRQFENNEWWQHVLVHEITHLLSVNIEEKDHKKNEEQVNKIMKEKLIEFNLDNLI